MKAGLRENRIAGKRVEKVMLYGSKNGKVNIDDTTIDYVCFGKGEKALIIIPGLGDGLRTVKGMALPLAYTYRIFARDYKVYIFSRRNGLKSGFSTSDMADDIVKSMKLLNIPAADFMGVSQGGMIAQCVAVNHPEAVKKLVLAVTSSKLNSLMERNLNYWIKRAGKKDYKSIFVDTAEKTYTEKYLRKCRKVYGILSIITKPKGFKRFIIQTQACLNHDMYNKLDMISSRTLVIGASDDKILGVRASREIAQKLNNCKVYIYKGYGHGVYQEAKDFNARVLNFLNDKGH